MGTGYLEYRRWTEDHSFHFNFKSSYDTRCLPSLPTQFQLYIHSPASDARRTVAESYIRRYRISVHRGRNSTRIAYFVVGFSGGLGGLGAPVCMMLATLPERL